MFLAATMAVFVLDSQGWLVSFLNILKSYVSSPAQRAL